MKFSIHYTHPGIIEYQQLKEPTQTKNAKGKKKTSETNQYHTYTWAKCHLHFKQGFTAICQKIFCLPIIDSNNSQKKVS